ncbi:MAG: hypothetical protein AAB738_01440 [Patescibacteria group bacterium]
MENENIETPKEKSGKSYLPMSIFASAIILAGALIYSTGLKYQQGQPNSPKNTSGEVASQSEVLSSVKLPIKWGDIGQKMVKSGVIDLPQLESLYAKRGGLPKDEMALLAENYTGDVVMTQQNSAFLLNVFWAFGLADKNQILEKGPMQDPQYGGAGKFASTGGWTLAKGNPMDHYSKYELVKLNPEQQLLVENVSKNIYRPCCGNSTYFPDCNHGMAMLGLLELMAANGVTESEMYRVALSVNSLWFPDTYLTIAKYFEAKGVAWDKVDPKVALGADYSSGYGYANILSQVQTPEKKSSGGGGCGA